MLKDTGYLYQHYPYHFTMLCGSIALHGLKDKAKVQSTKVIWLSLHKRSTIEFPQRWFHRQGTPQEVPQWLHPAKLVKNTTAFHLV